MIKAFIFDLDGTLADTIDDIGWAVNKMLEGRGFPLLSRAEHLSNINNGAFMLIKRSLPRDKAEDDGFVRLCLGEYEAHYSEHHAVDTYPYTGVKAALLRLAERGYKLAVLSNKQDGYVKSIAEKLFGDIPFSFVCGQTELPTKPDPTAALIIAEKLGMRPMEIAFVGDSQVDIKTALNAGMYPVGVSWGYRPAESLLAEGARVILGAPEEMAELPEKCV